MKVGRPESWIGGSRGKTREREKGGLLSQSHPHDCCRLLALSSKWQRPALDPSLAGLAVYLTLWGRGRGARGRAGLPYPYRELPTGTGEKGRPPSSARVSGGLAYPCRCPEPTSSPRPS